MRQMLGVFLAAVFLVCGAATGSDTLLADSMYGNMVMLQDATSARVSSWDRSGGNMDMRVIAPGETLELAVLADAGAIRHIYFTIVGGPVESVRYLNDLVLRMYWDGEETPSVEAPFGAFFGQGHNRIAYFQSLMFTVNPGAELADNPANTTLSVGFNCYYPMPFQKGARLTLTNEGLLPVGAVWYHIDYQRLRKVPKDAGRFHAQYRQERPTTGVGRAANINVCSSEGQNAHGRENYVILEAEGHGNFAGYFLNIDNATPGWYGEGDDMIFIDGEDWPPSIHGTGSEEIFGAGACPNIEYAGPYTGYHYVENKDYFAAVSSYRFYVADPVSFKKSIRATIEHGHANNFSNEYSSVAFWYQGEPHAALPQLPSFRERQSRTLREDWKARLDLPEGADARCPVSQGVSFSAGWHRFYEEKYGDAALWTAPGDPVQVCIYPLAHPDGGRFEIRAWIPADPSADHASDAPYIIRHANGEERVVVDLSKDTLSWKSLGVFELDGDSALTITNEASGNVVATAVMVIPASQTAE